MDCSKHNIWLLRISREFGKVQKDSGQVHYQEISVGRVLLLLLLPGLGILRGIYVCHPFLPFCFPLLYFLICIGFSIVSCIYFEVWSLGRRISQCHCSSSVKEELTLSVGIHLLLYKEHLLLCLWLKKKWINMLSSASGLRTDQRYLLGTNSCKECWMANCCCCELLELVFRKLLKYLHDPIEVQVLLSGISSDLCCWFFFVVCLFVLFFCEIQTLRVSFILFASNHKVWIFIPIQF